MGIIVAVNMATGRSVPTYWRSGEACCINL